MVLQQNLLYAYWVESTVLSTMIKGVQKVRIMVLQKVLNFVEENIHTIKKKKNTVYVPLKASYK